MARAAAPSRFRLSPDVRPATYEIHLEPALDDGTFRGRVRIGLRVARPQRAITLHAAELEIDAARIVLPHAVFPARVEARPRDEAVSVRAAEPVPRGDVLLELAFRGRMNPHLRGLYGARADGRAYAFTQCEAADARRIFPCFDEPAMKARFRLSVLVGDGDAALSNAPIEREEQTDGGRVVHFAETPPLSTYLFALAVGPLEATAPRLVGRTPVRVWHAPGKAHLADFGLEAGVESLVRLQRYFGLPYPYAKLDLVAVPDFEAGAMENAGAVFFRETLLLLDPATVSIAERKRAAEVIAHELAHMWYGNLVTMAWWDDLWLNEAFATWMAYRIVHEWKPAWRMWESFEHDRAAALGLDALVSTHPIYAPVHSVAEATENFDVITYEKGASVVRMLEHYLGPATFRRGVRRYMRRHKEGNAVAADLWRALAEASGQDVTRVARAWIEQAGFPLVTLTRLPARGGLRVRQERFFSDPKRRAAGRSGRWPVPMVLKAPGGGARTLVQRPSEIVRLPGRTRPAWVYGNAAAGGFYRVAHDPADLAALLAKPAKALTPVERLALVGDQWALVRSGRAPIESFLAVVDALGAETDHDVLDGLGSALALLDEQVVEPGSALQRRLRGWIAGRFGPAFAAGGWTPDPGEGDLGRLRRAALLRIVGGIAEDDGVMREARRWLDRYLADRSALEANLADPVTSLAARAGDHALYERYRGVIDEARTPQERRRFLLNLASFRTPDTVRRTLADALTPAIPTQDVAFVFMRLFGNPAGGEAAWRFLTAHWAAVRERIPPLMLARLVDATPALREPRFAKEVAAFFRANPLPEAARALKQALEVFRLNAELRRRVTRGLDRWLDERS